MPIPGTLNADIRLMRAIVIVAVCAAATAPLAAKEEPPSPARAEDSTADAPQRTAEELRRLIEQLGADDYHTREAASRALENLGPVAIPYLEDAVDSPILEVHTRAERLLAIVARESFAQQIQAFLADVDGRRAATLPGWERARRRLGESEDARRVFAEMYRNEPVLFEAYGPDDVQAAAAFHLRIDQLDEQKYQRNRSNYNLRNQLQQATSANLMALLFVAADRELEIPQPQVATFRTLFVHTWPPQRVHAAAEREYLRQWLAEWLLHRVVQPNREYDAILLGMQYDLPQVVDLAVSVLERTGGHEYSRMHAAQCVGKYGKPWHLSLVESLLSDETSIGPREHRLNQRGIRYETRVCDVALMVLLQRTGQDPKEYGFVDLDTGADYVYLFQSIAFESDEKRDEAFSKWNEWRKAHSLYEGEPPHPLIDVDVPR